MNALLSGILNVLTGGISSFFKGSNLSNWMNKAFDELQDVNSQNNLGNYLAQATGSRLTDAQREANAFTAAREDLAFNRSVEMANSQYQRTVADMKAAGLNPMFAASGGVVSSPSMNVSGSVSPSAGAFNLVDLLKLSSELGLMRSQRDNIEADTEKKKADTGKSKEETLAVQILNNYRQRSEELRLQGEGIRNRLNEANIKNVYKGIDLISNQIDLIRKQTQNEDQKISLTRAETILKNCQARQIVELIPYEKALKSAETSAQKEAAALSAANAAYQSGLIDNGYIESIVKSARSNASRDEINAEVSEIRSMFRTGKVPEQYNSGVNRFILRNVLQPLELLLDNFNPLASILGNAERL